MLARTFAAHESAVEMSELGNDSQIRDRATGISDIILGTVRLSMLCEREIAQPAQERATGAVLTRESMYS